MFMDPIIPNLPDDVALECLIRVPFDKFSDMGSVCRGWKTQIELPEFLRLRKSAGTSQNLVVLSQARPDISARNPDDPPKSCRVPVYHLVAFEPETGRWCDLPCLPEFSNGLPMFCHLVAVGPQLVVLGGYDPRTWEVMDSVFIFDFVTATWRHGARMPGGPRSFFGCASDENRFVFIAGGHDTEKTALKSAWVYDIVKDLWVPLPDMENERDECKGAFHRGTFHVISGYGTEMQGQFEKSVERFDVVAWRWTESDHGFLDATSCTKTCIRVCNQKLYMCQGNELIAREGVTWDTKAKLPNDVCIGAYLTTWHGKLLVIGCLKYGEPQNAYVMDAAKQTWTRIDLPEYYSGHVQSGCSLEI